MFKLIKDFTLGDAVDLVEKIEEDKALPLFAKQTVIAWEWWNCRTCRDTGITKVQITVDDFHEQVCPDCDRGEEAEMDDDS